MPSPAGIVLTAGAIAVANEVIFVPIEEGKGVDFSTFNLRIVTATALLALTFSGFDKISSPLGTSFAYLTLMAVLIIPVGHAPTPLENAGRIFSATGKAFK